MKESPEPLPSISWLVTQHKQALFWEPLTHDQLEHEKTGGLVWIGVTKLFIFKSCENINTFTNTSHMVYLITVFLLWKFCCCCFCVCVCVCVLLFFMFIVVLQITSITMKIRWNIKQSCGLQISLYMSLWRTSQNQGHGGLNQHTYNIYHMNWCTNN